MFGESIIKFMKSPPLGFEEPSFTQFVHFRHESMYASAMATDRYIHLSGSWPKLTVQLQELRSQERYSMLS